MVHCSNYNTVSFQQTVAIFTHKQKNCPKTGRKSVRTGRKLDTFITSFFFLQVDFSFMLHQEHELYNTYTTQTVHSLT